MPTTEQLEAREAQRRAARDLLQAKRPAEKDVEIHTDPDAVLVLEEAETRLGRLELSSSATAEERAEAREAVEEARKAVEETTATVRMRALGRRQYEALVDAHPPDPEKLDKYRAELGGSDPVFDLETFPPALVHACLIDPDDLDLFEVRGWYDEWPEAEFAPLYLTAYELCIRRRVADLKKG